MVIVTEERARLNAMQCNAEVKVNSVRNATFLVVVCVVSRGGGWPVRCTGERGRAAPRSSRRGSDQRRASSDRAIARGQPGMEMAERTQRPNDKNCFTLQEILNFERFTVQQDCLSSVTVEEHNNDILRKRIFFHLGVWMPI